MDQRVFLTNGARTSAHPYAKKKKNLDIILHPTQKLTQNVS